MILNTTWEELETMKPKRKADPSSPVILVVDDEKSVLDCVSEILRLQGYRVLATDDGVTALQMYQDHCQDIDLILTDLLMPGLSGMEMLQSMQAINPGLKAIVMSGYSEMISRAQDCGFSGGRLAKPFGVNQLTTEVTQMLAGASCCAQ